MPASCSVSGMPSNATSRRPISPIHAQRASKHRVPTADCCCEIRSTYKRRSGPSRAANAMPSRSSLSPTYPRVRYVRLLSAAHGPTKVPGIPPSGERPERPEALRSYRPTRRETQKPLREFRGQADADLNEPA
jgi:hypothetical protein